MSGRFSAGASAHAQPEGYLASPPSLLIWRAFNCSSSTLGSNAGTGIGSCQCALRIVAWHHDQDEHHFQLDDESLGDGTRANECPRTSALEGAAIRGSEPRAFASALDPTESQVCVQVGHRIDALR
eukprot:scaffold956_cov533-Prasinococcus_capsulatus_cf.AAC.6